MDKYHDSFPIRAYTKKELALCYFPEVEPHAAVNRLRTWIERSQPLRAELEGLGYQKNAKWLDARLVEVIVRYLGDP